MFRHQGTSRTLIHNLRIATVLSFVAGIVNVSGFLAFSQLTTNVTGHFAFFISDVADFEFWKGTIYVVYIFSFLTGAFCSSFLIERFRESKKLNVFVLPTLLEVVILISIGLFNLETLNTVANLVVCALLLAMGLQNSLVTQISDAVVRTTHLTGLFTDLGIELSQLFFKKYKAKHQALKATITLRLFIICFFFSGGLIGGFIYSNLEFNIHTLIIGAIILLISLFYDDFRYQFIRTTRRHQQRKNQPTNPPS